MDCWRHNLQILIIYQETGLFQEPSFKMCAIFRTLSSILVNNNNGTGREGYLLWGGNIASSKNPAEFNQLILK